MRHERETGRGGHYVLLEWGRTEELNDGDEVIELNTALAEASVWRDGWRTGLRLERTTRPEEDRIDGIFRSQWPHADQTIYGMTRWVMASANVSRVVTLHRFSATPILEVGRQWAKPLIEPAFFTPKDLFGSEKLWSFSLGIRLTAGEPHKRMGRYGAAELTQHH